MTTFEHQTYQEERALYGLDGAEVKNCTFAGETDGESPLKECRSIRVSDCRFELRYPFWHVTKGEIINCTLTGSCRAALWYDRDIDISHCVLGGIKALRECHGIRIDSSSANSKEFMWKCRNITIKNLELTSEYPFFECSDMQAEALTLCGKYSFQYTENLTICNSNLDTKDAFWHSKNVTVEDSVIKGEYLGWYSENLTLRRCHIIGTQPLCYAKGLILEDCTTESCDLSFERSQVTARINGNILSIKNPLSGTIKVDSVGEIIDPNPNCKIVIE